MTAPCYYHPDKIAVNTCVQCGLPICNDCTDRVGEKTVCHKCVQAVKTRLEAQMAASPTGVMGNAPPNYGDLNPNYGGGPPARDGGAFGGNNYVLPPEPVNVGMMALGGVLAVVIALVGAIVIEKFEINAHLSLSLLYVLLGYGVAWGLLRGTGRGSMPIAVASVGIYLVGIFAGQFAQAADLLKDALAHDPTLAGLTAAQIFPDVVRHEDFLFWVFVAFGAYGAFKYVIRRA